MRSRQQEKIYHVDIIFASIFHFEFNSVTQFENTPFSKTCSNKTAAVIKPLYLVKRLDIFFGKLSKCFILKNLQQSNISHD
ncbi:hypothetical protein T4B_5855 [Trichinella pseudospiralis]|uniref:Uncharacterized protein n=2 Tax=Trichinella pseudospiralis TaxID=6337 RepID=A0A0V1ERW7_TRIPS|nr:hypothetical protein T4A_827 [Trichinella pseudospiralis]KRY93675.1 hypothetical protein T4D_7237 [Trichinella pseudospiralis]KRZ31623.1 hypothetical protein T4B_5855 [Trichinella pseudospiralis]KRZ38189.1 hypothetical protein T4C_10312 [Trichinella pseudospiralis]